jgi:hypothetical protein
MTTRSGLVMAAAVIGAAVGLTGCPADSCPLETPQVNALPSCIEPPSQAITYPVRLCPTCNQTGASCDPDLSQVSSGIIFLDIKVEACSDSNSCGGAGCAPGPTTCAFTTPAAQGTYRVITSNAATGGTMEGSLLVTTSQPASCALPAAGI